MTPSHDLGYVSALAMRVPDMPMEHNRVASERPTRPAIWSRWPVWATASFVVATMVAGYLGLAGAIGWAPFGPHASPSAPTPVPGTGRSEASLDVGVPTQVPDSSSPDQPVDSRSSGLVLSKPDCTTHPEGTSRGPMRFMYVAEDPWVRTDFDTRCVPLNEFYLGADSKDAIPPIDSPLFVPAVGADEWLHPMEPVLVVSRDDVARAYPLQLLLFHEMVNDSIDGFPFLVTYCPLCNTALVFECSVGGQVYDFGTSGLLRGSDLVMYDRQTDSWWQQLTGEALVGAMSGSVLTPIAAQQVTWSAFKQAYPGGLVLSHARQATRTRRGTARPPTHITRLSDAPTPSSGPARPTTDLRP